MHGFATDVAESAKEKAKTATGWKKWLYIVLATLAAAAAWFTTGCQNIPDVKLTIEQLQHIGEVYTAAGGKVKYRVIPVENIKK